jgi:hypothetical protein
MLFICYFGIISFFILLVSYFNYLYSISQAIQDLNYFYRQKNITVFNKNQKEYSK